jgi:hypothetical protein
MSIRVILPNLSVCTYPTARPPVCLHDWLAAYLPFLSDPINLLHLEVNLSVMLTGRLSVTIRYVTLRYVMLCYVMCSATVSSVTNLTLLPSDIVAGFISGSELE